MDKLSSFVQEYVFPLGKLVVGGILQAVKRGRVDKMAMVRCIRSLDTLIYEFRMDKQELNIEDALYVVEKIQHHVREAGSLVTDRYLKDWIAELTCDIGQRLHFFDVPNVSLRDRGIEDSVEGALSWLEGFIVIPARTLNERLAAEYSVEIYEKGPSKKR